MEGGCRRRRGVDTNIMVGRGYRMLDGVFDFGRCEKMKMAPSR